MFVSDSVVPVMTKTILLTPLLRRRSIPKILFIAEQESCNCQAKYNGHHANNNGYHPRAHHY